MSTVSNKGFMMRYKSVTAILFTVVVPPPKLNRVAIAVPDAPLQTSLFIRQPPISVTPSLPIIPPSLLFSFLCSRMFNIISSSSRNCDLQYRADL